MATELGSIRVSVSGNVIPLRRDLTKAKRESKRAATAIEKDMRRVKTSMTGIASALGVTAGIASLGLIARSIVQTGATFDHEMKVVQAVSSATAKEFIQLESIALKMGETTEFTSTQAAEGLRFLSMAGFEATKSVAALPGTLDLATAGNIALSRAADVATNALTAMKLPVHELGRVNDAFIGTITRTNTNMEMMADSFRYAAPQASALGYDIERLSAMIGTLGNAGIQASMAGTQLNFAMAKTGRVFEELGIDGKGKDLIDALKAMNAAGWDAQRVMEIFGMRGSRAVLVMRSQIGALEELEMKLKNNEGEHRKLAATMRTSTVNQFKALKSAAEAAGLAVFKVFKEDIEGAVQVSTQFIRESKSTLAEYAELWREVNNLSIIHIGLVKGVWEVYRNFQKALGDEKANENLEKQKGLFGSIAGGLREVKNLFVETKKESDAWGIAQVKKLKDIVFGTDEVTEAGKEAASVHKGFSEIYVNEAQKVIDKQKEVEGQAKKLVASHFEYAKGIIAVNHAMLQTMEEFELFMSQPRGRDRSEELNEIKQTVAAIDQTLRAFYKDIEETDIGEQAAENINKIITDAEEKAKRISEAWDKVKGQTLESKAAQVKFDVERAGMIEYWEWRRQKHQDEITAELEREKILSSTMIWDEKRVAEEEFRSAERQSILDYEAWQVQQTRDRIQQQLTLEEERLEKEKELEKERQQQIETTAKMVSDRLAGSIMDIVTRAKSGKEAFADMAKSILADLTQMIIKQLLYNMVLTITNSLMKSLGFGASKGAVFDPTQIGEGAVFKNSTMQKFKMGDIFIHPTIADEVKKFQGGNSFTNSIVNKPTYFNIGEMGESGPEAIMPLDSIGKGYSVKAVDESGQKIEAPLKRMSDGSLGIALQSKKQKFAEGAVFDGGNGQQSFKNAGENNEGSTTHNYFHIVAMDSQSFADVVQRNPDVIVQVSKEGIKGGDKEFLELLKIAVEK
jgi:TP901 family phage tail tape measure protein